MKLIFSIVTFLRFAFNRVVVDIESLLHEQNCKSYLEYVAGL